MSEESDAKDNILETVKFLEEVVNTSNVSGVAVVMVTEDQTMMTSFSGDVVKLLGGVSILQSEICDVCRYQHDEESDELADVEVEGSA